MEVGKKIVHAKISPTIHFLPEYIELKIGEETVFSRSRIFMQNAQSGADWKR
jgi:hypothetical protein